jgi:hypothetical protein
MKFVVWLMFGSSGSYHTGNCWIVLILSITAVLNLGYAYPWGYTITSQGVRKQLAVRLKNTQYMVILVFDLIKIKQIAIFCYNNLVEWYNLFASWCNLDVGATQRGTSLIWGYASTKRLRTPDLHQ